MLRRHLSYKTPLKTNASSEPKYLLMWSYMFTLTCERSRAKKLGVSIKTPYPSSLKSLVVTGGGTIIGQQCEKQSQCPYFLSTYSFCSALVRKCINLSRLCSLQTSVQNSTLLLSNTRQHRIIR